MIDLLNLQPSQISRNLRGKFMLVYGAPKIGKTTLLSQLPNSLILAFEPGTNALNNAFVQPILTWAEFKQVLRDLRKAEVKEKFHFIGVDTADVAWELCEKYVCTQNDVSNIAEMAWGKGYALCKQEFSDAFREIALMGYGLCFVSHETEKKFQNEQGEEYVQLAPALPTRPYDIVNKLVDIIAYIRNIRNPETNEKKTFMFLRGDDRFLAGSRFKYIEEKIEFNYENLVNAIQDAIDKQVEQDGSNTTEDYNVFYKKQESRSFNEAMDEAKGLWTKLTQGNEDNALKILSKIEKIFGRKMKLSEATESQLDLLELVILEMRDM